MEKIYLIEDDDGLKYVGRTIQTFNDRLTLDHCDIICLDIADSEEEARELEWFYINSIDCVNELKYNYDEKEYKKEYCEKNRDKLKARGKEYREKNREELNKKKREIYKRNRDEINSKQNEYYEKNRDEINRKRRERYHKKQNLII